jgi:hypothetical protein
VSSNSKLLQSLRTLPANMHRYWCIRAVFENLNGFLGILVPGRGVEPRRAEARRILSPLRLPVPPSRHFVEMLDSTAYFTFYVFAVYASECETVQVNVKVFMDFHRSLSLTHELLCGSSRATMSTWPSNNEDIRTRFYHPTHSQPHL